MKRLTLLLPGAMCAVCATYTGIYLVRWEWNRAIIAGVFFLAAELIVVGVLVLDRMRRTEERVAAMLAARAASEPPAGGPVGEDPSAVALDALRATSPPPADRFTWLRDQSGQMNVFLPILLGAGVIASALAWAVEHLARATLSPAMERRLAARMSGLALPAHGLLGAPAAAAPATRRAWPGRVLVAVLAVAMGALTAMAIDFVADRTQTRPDVRVADARTTVELRLFGEIADRDPERVLHHLWAVCTGPDVFRARTLPAPVVEHRPDGVVHILVDADVGHHGGERLRGCLNDTTLDKVQARVVGFSVG